MPFLLTRSPQALDALKDGIVDGVGGLEEVLTLIQELNLTTKNDKGVYGALKREMWRESLALLENSDKETARDVEAKQAEAKAIKDSERRVRNWDTQKAKL